MKSIWRSLSSASGDAPHQGVPRSRYASAFAQGVMRGLAAPVEAFGSPAIARRDSAPISPSAGFERDGEALRDDFRRAEAAVLGRRAAGRIGKAG